MIVVADTSPLNYLIRLNRVELLAILYGRVAVPKAVATELLHAAAPQEVRSWMSAPPAWLEVHSVSPGNENSFPELDKGEREAILLATEVKADVLLMDERAG